MTLPIKNGFSFLEFFAGGGMARIGLGDGWRCLLANDIDSQKCAAYRTNFGGADLIEGDIAAIDPARLPGERVDLVWGSFPCQDLSLAGARAGMRAARSGAVFSLWRHVETLARRGAHPRIIALENVAGLLTSNNGSDFETVITLMTKAGYRTTACILDASRFTPQSRPRLFILAFAPEIAPPAARTPVEETTTPAVQAAAASLPAKVRARWFWLDAALRARRNIRLGDIVDWDAPRWHEPAQTRALIEMMAPRQRARLDALVGSGARRAGAAFRRTRTENGAGVQRLEARFDGLAGCLRTPAGGSSRQIVIAVDKGEVRTRLLSPREAAQLMGLPDDYILPDNTGAALKLCGDGVCVPAVRWLAEHVLEPALARSRAAPSRQGAATRAA